MKTTEEQMQAGLAGRAFADVWGRIPTATEAESWEGGAHAALAQIVIDEARARVGEIVASAVYSAYAPETTRHRDGWKPPCDVVSRAECVAADAVERGTVLIPGAIVVARRPDEFERPARTGIVRLWVVTRCGRELPLITGNMSDGCARLLVAGVPAAIVQEWQSVIDAWRASMTLWDPCDPSTGPEPQIACVSVVYAQRFPIEVVGWETVR